MPKTVFDDERFCDAYEAWFGSVVVALMSVSSRALPPNLHRKVFRAMLALANPLGRSVGFCYVALKWVVAAFRREAV